jgi:hypothetical protein
MEADGGAAGEEAEERRRRSELGSLVEAIKSSEVRARAAPRPHLLR